MKDIKGFEGFYAVTKSGDIYSYGKRSGANHNGKFIKCSKDKDGYRRVTLNANNNKRHARVGRLVLETFNPTTIPFLQVNHKDGKRDNDNLENLEWVTCSENIKHSFTVLNKNQKGAKNNCFKKWGYFDNNEKLFTIDNKSVDEWCIENNIASTTIYTSMREKRKLKIGKFKGFRFFRQNEEFGSTDK